MNFIFKNGKNVRISHKTVGSGSNILEFRFQNVDPVNSTPDPDPIYWNSGSRIRIRTIPHRILHIAFYTFF